MFFTFLIIDVVGCKNILFFFQKLGLPFKGTGIKG